MNLLPNILVAASLLLVASCAPSGVESAPSNRTSSGQDRGKVKSPKVVAANLFIDDAGQFFSTRDAASLLLIEGGDFQLGDSRGRYDEQPSFRARLSTFLIDTTEVSNAQFDRFINASGYAPAGPWRRGYLPGGEDLPVRFVTWFDAKAYADWAGRRLPTEAEWEAACGQRRYTWGDEWLRGCSITDRDEARGPVDVGIATDKSPQGVLNLAGNVREWCSDWYDRYAYADYAETPIQVDPRGPADASGPREPFVKAGAVAGNERSTRKVVRGGGWASEGREYARRARRGAHNPHQHFNDVGFRCAQSVEVGP